MKHPYHIFRTQGSCEKSSRPPHPPPSNTLPGVEREGRGEGGWGTLLSYLGRKLWWSEWLALRLDPCHSGDRAHSLRALCPLPRDGETSGLASDYSYTRVEGPPQPPGRGCLLARARHFLLSPPLSVLSSWWAAFWTFAKPCPSPIHILGLKGFLSLYHPLPSLPSSSAHCVSVPSARCYTGH